MATRRFIAPPALRHAARAQRLAAPVLDQDRPRTAREARPQRGGGQADQHGSARDGRATGATRHATGLYGGPLLGVGSLVLYRRTHPYPEATMPEKPLPTEKEVMSWIRERR